MSLQNCKFGDLIILNVYKEQKTMRIILTHASIYKLLEARGTDQY